jgi:hypothetical protein
VLQFALRDIGQLTDFETTAGTATAARMRACAPARDSQMLES